jgi:hypothetical protein
VLARSRRALYQGTCRRLRRGTGARNSHFPVEEHPCAGRGDMPQRWPGVVRRPVRLQCARRRTANRPPGGPNRKEARKAAGAWEEEINSGRARLRTATTWEQFRLRYEDEVLPGLMPQVLMDLMRHESIETTQRYYIGRNANVTADAVWEAYKRAQEGTVFSTVGQRGPSREAAEDGLSLDATER